MRRYALVLVTLLAAGSDLAPRGFAEDGAAPAAGPVEFFEQTDRRKTMSMKLPRTWKSAPDDEANANALAAYTGFWKGNDGPNGEVFYFARNEYARALLARSIELPAEGTVQPASLRQGPGWAEGCAFTSKQHAVWLRFVEKGGRVYLFHVEAHVNGYPIVHETVEKLLDTATVPGDAPPTALPGAFTPRKIGEFDVMSDADADRASVLKKSVELIGKPREILAKALGGKPFDASRPFAWMFQQGTVFEERAKAGSGVRPEQGAFALFSPANRAVFVKVIGEGKVGFEEQIYEAGARQYTWQYFGGKVPIWLDLSLSGYGQLNAILATKGKTATDALSAAKAAAAGATRRLDQWLDLVNPADVTDERQSEVELSALQVFIRSGKGAKKYRKQLDSYVQTLRDSGDPALARKSFDGVNFEEMLTEFKAWSSDWK